MLFTFHANANTQKTSFKCHSHNSSHFFSGRENWMSFTKNTSNFQLYCGVYLSSFQSKTPIIIIYGCNTIKCIENRLCHWYTIAYFMYRLFCYQLHHHHHTIKFNKSTIHFSLSFSFETLPNKFRIWWYFNKQNNIK